MADHVQLNPGLGGDKLAAHDLGSDVKLQRIIQQGISSAGNTTTTPLGSGLTFTGTWEQNDYHDVMVSCHTDNGGTLYFDFSPDGTNINTFPVNGFQIEAGIHEFHTAVKGPRYFRLRLVNNTGAQTFLRLYTYYGSFRVPNSPINSNISSDSDAVVVRSISSSTDLAFGKFQGMLEDEKFGSVRLIDALDAPVDVWAYGSDDVQSGADKTFPTTSQSLFMSSDSASDTDVDVDVTYIDTTGAEQTVTVNSNGTTPVDLGVDGFDINRAVVSNANLNVGNIYFNTENNHTGGVPNTPSTVLAFIRAGDGQTQLGTRTVPVNKKMRIKNVYISVSRASGTAGSARVSLRTRAFGGSWIVKRPFDVVTGSSEKQVAGLIISGRSSVKFTVDEVSDSDTNIQCSWIYEEVDE